jgi:predicted exporter
VVECDGYLCGVPGEQSEMSLYDWLRVTELVIAIAGIYVWVRVSLRRGRRRAVIYGPVLALVLLIVYNLIRLCGIDIVLVHGSMSHAIRIMFLIVISGGGLVMLWER